MDDIITASRNKPSYATERERMITENRGLVYLVAGRYIKKQGLRHEDTEDIIQEAEMGLINAVDRFKPELGYAFSTYAVPVISGKIMRWFRDHPNYTSIKIPRSPIYSGNSDEARKAREIFREARLDAQVPGKTKDDVTFKDLLPGPPDTYGVYLDDMLETIRALLYRGHTPDVAERMLLCLTEYVLEGRTQDEIAADMGISQAHVHRSIRIIAELCSKHKALFIDGVPRAGLDIGNSTNRALQ